MASANRLAQTARHLSAAAAPSAAEPEFTMDEVRRQGLIVLRDGVYDFSSFAKKHPGGARALRHHAGSDATDVFCELHSQSIFAKFGPRFRIGRLASTESVAAVTWPGVAPLSNVWEGLPPEKPIDPLSAVLHSPFPHQRFDGTGIEGFRFNWAIGDKLLRLGEDGEPTAPSGRLSQTHFHRQKSHLAVLDHERDWLHVGAPEQYVYEMLQKEEMLLAQTGPTHPQFGDLYVTCAESKAAEQELLDLVLQFLLLQYSERFAMEANGAVIATLTPGYRRRFVLDEWKDRPLMLVTLLVQEDFYLLQEQDIAKPVAADFPVGRAAKRELGFEYSGQDFKEDHPSGKKHVLVASSSTLSFPGAPFRGKSMIQIHHPGVPAWWYSLQRGMNRLFAEMEPELSWFRHNYGFSLSPTVESLGKSSRRNLYAAAPQSMEQLGQAAGSDFIRHHVCLNVEYQTFRRLRGSNYIVFGIRQYADRCAALEMYPGCAASMAAAIRRKNTATLVRGLPKQISTKVFLGYLDRLATRAGLYAGPLPGVAEPWDRSNKPDGTVVGEGLVVADGRQQHVRLEGSR